MTSWEREGEREGGREGTRGWGAEEKKKKKKAQTIFRFILISLCLIKQSSAKLSTELSQVALASYRIIQKWKEGERGKKKLKRIVCQVHNAFGEFLKHV